MLGDGFQIQDLCFIAVYVTRWELVRGIGHRNLSPSLLKTDSGAGITELGVGFGTILLSFVSGNIALSSLTLVYLWELNALIGVLFTAFSAVGARY